MKAGAPQSGLRLRARSRLNRLIWISHNVAAAPIFLAVNRVCPDSRAAQLLLGGFCCYVLRIMGIRIEIGGLDHYDRSQRAIVVANHQSHLDFLALRVALGPIRCVVSNTVLTQRVFGRVMRGLGAISLDTLEVNLYRRTIGDLSLDGLTTSLAIFPEQQRAPVRLLPFKTGAFVLAIQSGIPVLPVAIHGIRAATPGNPASYFWLGPIFPTTVRIEVLESVRTHELTYRNRHALRHQVRTAIARALDEKRSRGGFRLGEPSRGSCGEALHPL